MFRRNRSSAPDNQPAPPDDGGIACIVVPAPSDAEGPQILPVAVGADVGGAPDACDDDGQLSDNSEGGTTAWGSDPEKYEPIEWPEGADDEDDEDEEGEEILDTIADAGANQHVPIEWPDEEESDSDDEIEEDEEMGQGPSGGMAIETGCIVRPKSEEGMEIQEARDVGISLDGSGRSHPRTGSSEEVESACKKPRGADKHVVSF